MPALRRPSLFLLAAPAALLLAGCEHSNSPVDPAGSSSTPFSQVISAQDFQDSLADSTTLRVRVRLDPGTLVARRIVLKRARHTLQPEEVEGRVSFVASGATADTLTFHDLGDLKVVVTDSTKFKGGRDHDHDGDDGGKATRAEFITRLTVALAAGHRPFVEASRPPAANPQAPGDSSFVATAIRFDDGDEAAEIELNVTKANFTRNQTPPPEGWLTLLGLKIEIDADTRITTDLPRADFDNQFNGTVTAVDTAAHTVTLADSTVLRFVAGTEIESGGFGFGLSTLADVQAALVSGKTVTAHGRGLLETATPRTFDVIEVRFNLIVLLASM